MEQITISADIAVTPKQAWECYLNPEDNKHWNTAGEGWSTGFVNIDVAVGGKWEAEYKSPDGKNDFVFGGTFTEIVEGQKIAYDMGDIEGFETETPRHVEVLFEKQNNNDICTKVTVIFDAENENSIDLQREGWTNILQNFKNFVERKADPSIKAVRKIIDINSTPSTIFDVLFNPETYKIWTAPFLEGLYYEGEIKYGSIVRFLTPDMGGMIGKVVVYIPDFQVSFENLGVIKDGVDDYDSPELKAWRGARETYTLTKKGNVTTLEVYQAIATDEFEGMNNLSDSALAIVKKLSEKAQ